MAEGALDDVKVIDLSTDVAGPYCTKILAEYGADVIKVEEPRLGDITRREGPFPNDEPDPEKSGLFLFLNTNKKGVTLNLKVSAGIKILKELIQDTDILVESFPPGTMASLGLDYETLEKMNPKLIMASITDFGQSGPYRDYQATDIIHYALGGFSNLSGNYDQEPLQFVLKQAQFMAARNANLAIIAALYFQRETGMGQYIDVSIMESVASQPPFQVTRYGFTGGIETRGPRHKPALDTKCLECKDGGWITMTTSHGAIPFEQFAELLGIPELLNPKFASSNLREDHAQELEELVAPKVKKLDRYGLFHDAAKKRFAFGVVQTPPEILNCPHLEARGFFSEVKHPKAGKFKYPGGCVSMNGTPSQLRTAAPLLGYHNEEVYCRQLGYKKKDLLKLREQGVI